MGAGGVSVPAGTCYSFSMNNPLLARRYWVFDLDGTLTVPAHDFAAIRKRLCIPEEADILAYIDSRENGERARLRKLLDEIEGEVCAIARPAQGASHLMEVLRRRGARVGILTRNTRDIAARTLSAIGIGGYFEPDCILGRDEAAPKPDPDGIFRLGFRWSASAADMVMVGDYLFDLQAGRSAGAATVHVDQSARFRWPHLTDLPVATPGALAAMVAASP